MIDMPPLPPAMLVGLDPAYIPVLDAAEAELRRQEENAKAAIWETGFKAGLQVNLADVLRDQVGAKNPYHYHGPPPAT